MAKKQKKQATPPKKKRKIVRQLADQPTWFTNFRLQSLVLFLFCTLLYANTISHDYTQDDAIVLYDNMFVNGDADNGIKGILTKDTFFGFFKEEGKANLVAGGRYRPLTLIQFAIGWSIFGNTPMAYHAMNIFWYAATCLMLYWLLLRLFKNKQNQTFAYFVAFAATLLFAAHPIHTEAVANIKGRDEIMTLLGSLAATYFVLRAYDEKWFGWNVVAAVCFLLGLLAKENAITFLAVIPLSLYFFRATKWNQIVLQSLPIFGVAIGYILVRQQIVGLNVGELSKELMNNPFLKIENGRWVDFTIAEWSATIVYTLGKYLQLLILPHPLTHDYYPRHIDIMSWSDWQVLLSFGIYAVLGIYALVRLPKKDPVSYGILFYLATLSIVSNIVFPIGTNMGERFAFVPSVGFCFIAALLLWRLARLLAPQKQLLNFAQLRIPLVVLGAVVALFAAKTITRNFVWKDNFTLFTTDINTSPNSAKLRNGAAGALIDKAQSELNTTTKEKMIREGIGHATAALQLHPTYKNAFLLQGNGYLYLSQYDAAIQAYKNGLNYYPQDGELSGNLAIAYLEAGREQGEKLGNISKSIEYLEAGRQLRPNKVELLRLLGIAYGMGRQTTKAIEVLERAVTIEPNNASVLYNLGTAHYAAGNAARANELVNKAKTLDPSIGQ